MKTKYPWLASRSAWSLQEGRTALAGPPWTMTTIGAFDEGMAPGESSHPCTSKSSLFQRMLRASPAGVLRRALRSVNLRQLPRAPATISGGSENDSRMAAEVNPSAENEAPTPQRLWMDSLPRQRMRGPALPSAGTEAKALSPSI